MKRIIQIFIVLAAIGQIQGDVLAEKIIKFGTCDIQISDLVDDGRTMFLQQAIVEERKSGFARKIEAFKLTDSFSAKGFPIPGIDTFVIKEWTGGAACCYFYYIITHQKASKRTSFQVISSGRGEGDIAIPKDLTFVEDKPALELCDSFWIPDKVDWPQRQPCHADSPMPTRLIVFDSDLLLWQDIFPKRLISYHRKRFTEVKKRFDRTNRYDGISRFSLAIEAAYHAYMSGLSNTEMERLLYNMVPTEYGGKNSESVASIRRILIERADSFQAVEFWLPD